MCGQLLLDTEHIYLNPVLLQSIANSILFLRIFRRFKETSEIGTKFLPLGF